MEVRHLRISILVAALVFSAGSVTPEQAQAQSPGPDRPGPTPASLEQMRPFAQFLNEVSDRRRRVVYTPNPQTLFDGANSGFVNVGSGNLTLARRDLVVPAHLPIVMARVYDSRLGPATDFGASGWRLSMAESIQTRADGSATWLNDTGATVELAAGDAGYRLAQPRPTDIRAIDGTWDGVLVVGHRNGLEKTFVPLGSRHRLTAVADAFGNGLALQYDGAHRLASVEATDTSRVDIERDAQGRIVAIADGTGQAIGYQYDGVGRLRTVYDRGGHGWHYEYDGAGRLVAALAPGGQLDLAAAYRPDGRVEEVFSHGASTRYEYDLAMESRPDLNVTRVLSGYRPPEQFGQNPDGITVLVQNRLGTRTDITLDQDNRPVRLASDGDTRQEFSYDARGSLVGFKRYRANGATESMTVSYTGDGRLQSLVGATGIEHLRIRYDRDGNGFSVADGAGTAAFQRDGRGAVTALAFDGADGYRFTRDPRGLITGITDPQQRTAVFAFEPDGTLGQVRYADGSTQQFDYDSAGLRATSRREDGRALHYFYTPAGSLYRFERHTSGGGVIATNYQLDAESRLTRIVEDDTVHSFRYDATGELAEVKWSAGHLSFTYDDAGRFTGVANGNGEHYRYRYREDEPDLRVQLDAYTRVDLSGRIDSGPSFATLTEVLHNRTVQSLYGPVYLDQRLGQFRVVNDSGVIAPGALDRDALVRTRLLAADATSPGVTAPSVPGYDRFIAPSNFLFVPPEFWSLNCNVCPPSMPHADPTPGRNRPDDAAPIDTLALIGDQLQRCGSGSMEPPSDCQLSVSGLPRYLCNLQQAQIGATLSPANLNGTAITWQLNDRLVQVPVGQKGPTTKIRGASTVNANGTVKARYSSNRWVCSSPVMNMPVRANELTDYSQVISLDACPERQQDSDLAHQIDGCSIPPVTASIFPGDNVQDPVGGQFNAPGTSTAFGTPQSPVAFGSAPLDLPCNNHDVCYQTCGQAQQGCDNAILDDMYSVCATAYPPTCPFGSDTTACSHFFTEQNACQFVADTVYTGLLVFGSTAYRIRQVEYCDCCPP